MQKLWLPNHFNFEIIFCYSFINECFMAFMDNLFQEYLICMFKFCQFCIYIYQWCSHLFYCVLSCIWSRSTPLHLMQHQPLSVLKGSDATEELLGEAESKGHDSSLASTPQEAHPCPRKARATGSWTSTSLNGGKCKVHWIEHFSMFFFILKKKF